MTRVVTMVSTKQSRWYSKNSKTRENSSEKAFPNLEFGFSIKILYKFPNDRNTIRASRKFNEFHNKTS